MAQNSRFGGPSITPEEAADPTPPSAMPIRVRRPELGLVDRERYDSEERAAPPVMPNPEELEWDGNSSKASTLKESTSEEKPKPTPRKPARTTGNRSKAQDPEMDSDADSTDGNGPNNGTKQSDDSDLFDDI